MNIVEIIKKDITIYIVCLIAILICSIYYYNIEDYQAANNKAWKEWATECNCQCLMSTQPIPYPNVTKEFKIPIIEELKGDNNEHKDNTVYK